MKKKSKKIKTKEIKGNRKAPKKILKRTENIKTNNTVKRDNNSSNLEQENTRRAVGYILEAKSRGVSDGTIEDKLIDKGYMKRIVEKAFSFINNEDRNKDFFMNLRRRTFVELVVLVVITLVFIEVSYKLGFIQLNFSVYSVLFYFLLIFFLFEFIFLMKRFAKIRRVIKPPIKKEKKNEINEIAKRPEEKVKIPILKMKTQTTLPLKFKKEAGIYETDLDILYKLIEDVGRAKVSELAKYFGVTKKKIEEWAKILEEYQLLDIHYPAIGEIQIIKISKDESKNK